jgi:O-glycosyl hydrolase
VFIRRLRVHVCCPQHLNGDPCQSTWLASIKSPQRLVSCRVIKLPDSLSLVLATSAMAPGLSLLCATAAQLALVAAQITVNLGTTYQTIDGFGMSAAFGQASAVQSLSSAQQQQAVNLLFSTSSGAGLTILRNRVGSGGSGDSIEPNSPGSSSAKPTYTWDGNDSGQVWLSKQARLLGVEYIYADAWSAPGFMKTNNNQVSYKDPQNVPVRADRDHAL